MYYLMYPSLYSMSNYVANRAFDKEILTMKFYSLEDAVTIVKRTRVCLREMNWYVYRCNFFTKTRISLNTLYKMNLFSDTIGNDEFGMYYNWK